MHSLLTDWKRVGKNSNEKLKLKDILEDVEGNPKEGDNNTMELMKKELKRLKVADNQE